MECEHPQFKANPEFKHCPDCGAPSSLTPEDRLQYKLEELEKTHGLRIQNPEVIVQDIQKIVPKNTVYVVKHHRMENKQKKAFLRYRLLKYLKRDYPRFVSRPQWKKAFVEAQKGVLVLHEDFEEALLYDYKITQWNKTLGKPKK